MTLGGWVMLIVSVSCVTGLFLWCVYKVLATPGATEHIHSPVDIEEPDTTEE